MPRKNRRRLWATVATLSLLFQGLALAPLISASDEALPDPPLHRPAMPPEVAASLGSATGDVAAGLINNRVHRLEAADIAALEAAGGKLLVNEDGLIEFSIGTASDRAMIALYDARTVSGIAVIGLGFARESDLASASALELAALIGPRTALADTRPYDHTHTLPSPFHTCSYLYQYAAGSGRDAYVHICAVDVGNARWVGSAMATVLGLVAGNPVLSLIGVLIVNIGLSLFQQNDGSINLYVPGSASVNHYGYTYYYSRYTYWQDWYYHNPYGSTWYCYVTKYSNGYHYYECVR